MCNSSGVGLVEVFADAAGFAATRGDRNEPKLTRAQITKTKRSVVCVVA